MPQRAQNLRQWREQRVEEDVVDGLEQRVVEGQVGLDESWDVGVSVRVAHLLDERRHASQMLVAAPGRGELGDPDLDGAPGLEQALG